MSCPPTHIAGNIGFSNFSMLLPTSHPPGLGSRMESLRRCFLHEFAARGFFSGGSKPWTKLLFLACNQFYVEEHKGSKLEKLGSKMGFWEAFCNFTKAQYVHWDSNFYVWEAFFGSILGLVERKWGIGRPRGHREGIWKGLLGWPEGNWGIPHIAHRFFVRVMLSMSQQGNPHILAHHMFVDMCVWNVHSVIAVVSKSAQKPNIVHNCIWKHVCFIWSCSAALQGTCCCQQVCQDFRA